MTLAISVVALGIAMTALGVALQGVRGTSRRGGSGRRGSGRTVDYLPRDTAALRREVAVLTDAQKHTFRHMAVIRYDAFGDVGGTFSWTLALLDDSGGGVLLTSIHGRNETRTYAKSVTGWRSDQTLTPEEERALAEAKQPPAPAG